MKLQQMKQIKMKMQQNQVMKLQKKELKMEM